MTAELKTCGLAAHFPLATWPPTLAVNIVVFFIVRDRHFVLLYSCAEVRELATKVKERKKWGETKPFVFCDLRKCVFVGAFHRESLDFAGLLRFLPSFCAEHTPVKPNGSIKGPAYKVALRCPPLYFICFHVIQF